MRARYWLEYLVLRAVVAVAPRLGPSGRRRVGSWLGNLAHRVGVRHARVPAHLRLAFPDVSDSWIDATARACYEHFLRESLDTFSLHAEPNQVRALTRVNGLEPLLRELEHSGVVMLVAHLGNWEVGFGGLAARGLPLNLVYKDQTNPLFNRWVVRLRKNLGVRVVDRKRKIDEGYRLLSAREPLVLANDQHAPERGAVELPFFGRTVHAHRGPALFAWRAKVPVYYFSCIRADAQYEVQIDKLISANDIDVSEEIAVKQITQLYLQRVEQDVKRWPEQYFWFHRRWRGRALEQTATVQAG